jgi:hypothetical protein
MYLKVFAAIVAMEYDGKIEYPNDILKGKTIVSTLTETRKRIKKVNFLEILHIQF